MLIRFFLHLSFATFFSLFSTPVFSHAGSHESKDCFITFHNNETLRFSGYQFQGLHPDEAFCRVLPYLGSVIIKLEPVSYQLNQQQVQLALVSVLNSDHSQFLKKIPLQNFKNGAIMLEADIQVRGLYLLSVHLKDVPTPPQKFFFLVGIPVTKILVLFSGAVFVLLIGMTIIARYKRKIDIPPNA